MPGQDVFGSTNVEDLSSLDAQAIGANIKGKAEGIAATMVSIKTTYDKTLAMRDDLSKTRASLVNERDGIDPDSDGGKDKIDALNAKIAGLDTAIKVCDGTLNTCETKMEDCRGQLDALRDDGRRLLAALNQREQSKEAAKNNATQQNQGQGQQPGANGATNDAKAKDTVLSALNTMDSVSTIRLGEQAVQNDSTVLAAKTGASAS